MKKHLWLTLPLFGLLFVIGCENGKNGTSTENDSLTAVVDTVAIRIDDQECLNLQPGQFCAAGLDFLKLGDSLLWNEHIVATLPDAILKDTVFTEFSPGAEGDSVSWFAKILRMPDGDIYLDSDFEQGQFLGRIRIESGRYHHASGLRVGSTAKEVKAFASTAYVYPYSEYHLMEVTVPYQNTKIIFHFEDTGIVGVKDEYSLNDIPDAAKVVRIVLM